MLNIKKFKTGIKVEPKTTLESDAKGELEVENSSGKLNYHDGSVRSPIVTEDSSATLENKTIDADNNTISNLEVDNFKSSAIDLDDTLATADDTKIPTSLTVKNYVDSQIQTKDEASEIIYDNTDSGLAATNLQDAVDEVEGRLDTAESDISDNATDISNHITNTVDAHDSIAIVFDNTVSGLIADNAQDAIDELDGRLDTVETAAGDAQTDIDNHINDTTDAHDASAISNLPAGNLASTDVQGALNELQSDVDSRALDSDLTNHISDTSTHGVTGDIVGTTDTQTLTNKTIQGASIESPTRLDVKKDTKANLETYAATATDGQLVFATDEQVLYQIVNNLLIPAGSGSGVGSVDILYAETFELSVIGDFTTTGTTAITETAIDLIQGTKTLELDHTGGSSVESPSIPVDRKFRGKRVYFTFDLYSEAADGNIELTVEDVTNTNVLLNAVTVSKQLGTATSLKKAYAFTIPSDCEDLSWKIDALAEASVSSFIDNIVIQLESDIYQQIEYEVTQSSYINAGAFNGVAVSGSLTSNTNTGLYSYNSSTGLYTMLKRARIHIHYNTKSAGAATVEAEIRIDGSAVMFSNSQNSTNFNATVSYSDELDAGQTILCFADGNSSENRVAIVAVEIRDAYQVIGGGVENTYSARITNNGTAAIASQSYPFIDSVSRTGLGVVVIDITSLGLTVAPEVQATAEVRTVIANVTAVSPTSITVDCQGNSGTGNDNNFSLRLDRQGSDYRTPSKAIGLPTQRIAYIKDVKAANTAGGTFTSGSFQTRTLNNIVDPTGIVTSLTSNQFTLPAGTYDTEAVSTAFRVDRHKAKLRNVTDSTDVLIGSSEYSLNTDSVTNSSAIRGRFTITSSKTFELQHRCDTTHSTNGFGIPSNFGVDEVYAQIKLTRIEE